MSPDALPAEIALPLAAVLWLIVAVQARRSGR